MLKIVLGNKNYSSWSMRPWLVLEHFGIPFEETVVPLDQPDTEANIRRFSPSGRVPCLIDGTLAIWDTLAICEYLAERQAGLWPADPAARAVARSVCAEMHSGFAALRNDCPVKVKETFPPAPLRPEVQADVARIEAIWADCRARFRKGGPFLFGAFTIADAFYAPVVTRFRTYSIPISAASREYVELIWALPAMQKWAEAARRENFIMARYEKRQQ